MRNKILIGFMLMCGFAIGAYFYQQSKDDIPAVIKKNGEYTKGQYLVQGLSFKSLEQYFSRYSIPFEMVDQESFVILSDGLAYDVNTIYYRKEKIPNDRTELLTEYKQKLLDMFYEEYPDLQSIKIDPETFQYLKWNYGLARDAKNVFMNGTVLNKAHPKMVQAITELIYSDGNAIYNLQQLVTEDVENFEWLGGIFLQDSKNIYAIDPWNIRNVHKLENMDRNSFGVVNNRFAKDRNKILIGLQEVPNIDHDSVKFFDSYFVDRNRGYFILDNDTQLRIINDVDIETFEDLGNYYAKDKNYAYFKGRRIIGADAASFTMNEYGIPSDQNGAYVEGYIIVGADASTIQKIPNSPYHKDKYSVYFQEIPLLGSDPKSFKVLKDPSSQTQKYGIDQNNFYQTYFPVGNVDVNTLEVIGNGWFKDKDHVIFDNAIVSGLEPKTFQILSDSIVRDDNSVYYLYRFTSKDDRLTKINNIADTKTFKHLKFAYYADSQNIYYMQSDFSRVKMTPLDADVKSFEIKAKGKIDNPRFETSDDYIIRDAKGCFQKMERVKC